MALHQGWPKFAASSLMRSADGVAVMSLVPVTLHAQVNGGPVSITVDSEYPFRSSADITVQAGAPLMVSIRIPAWAQGASVRLDGRLLDAPVGGFAHADCSAGNHTIMVQLPMRLVVENRYQELVVLKRGPLVYSLPIGETWVHRSKPEGEERPWLNNYEVLPTTPWNYGLALDCHDPARSAVIEQHPVGDCPFSPEGAPVAITVPARMVPWGMECGCAAPLPAGPAQGPVEQVRLIPYGCTNLRLTEMPLV